MNRSDRQSALLRLLALALSDGELQKEEQVFLLQVAEQYGFSRQEIYALLFQDSNTAMEIPDSPKDRFEHLVDLAVMMLMDRQLSPPEIRLFHLLGTYLGFSAQMLERVVMVVREEIQGVVDYQALRQQLLRTIPISQN